MSAMELQYDRMSLRQLTELEYILLGDLRDVLEEEATEENRKWLLVIVEALLGTLPREFALRERGGYMQDVLLTSPELNSNVQHLQDEHGSLCAELQLLKDRLEESAIFTKQADSLKHQLAHWMETLLNHNRVEEKLVQEAYQQDTGVGD